MPLIKQAAANKYYFKIRQRYKMEMITANGINLNPAGILQGIVKEKTEINFI